MSSEPDSTQTLAVLEMNARETVHVRILGYHGNQYVGIRVFSGSQDRPLPTKKGLALPIEHVPARIDALGRVDEASYGAEDDPLTRQYRAMMAGSEPGEGNTDMSAPNTFIGAG